MALVSASILACDQTRLGEQVLKAEEAGVDYIHVDIMDGVYVENMTFGPQTIIDLKKISRLKVSLHFEVCHPETFLPIFEDVGADIITFQLDACANPLHLIQEIKKMGIKAGIGIGPTYGIERLQYLLPHIDWLIMMSAEPGYGGQPLNVCIYEKTRQARALMEKTGYHVPISIDGGVNDSNGKLLVDAGADVLIAGSYIFQGEQVVDRVQKLKAL
ncbi:MAG: ribulose-phosphate 3-epimerase [Eubacterium sp.]